MFLSRITLIISVSGKAKLSRLRLPRKNKRWSSPFFTKFLTTLITNYFYQLSIIYKGFRFATILPWPPTHSHQKCSIKSCLKVWNFIKKRLKHGCFNESIAKFLRTLILMNICERLLLFNVKSRLILLFTALIHFTIHVHLYRKSTLFCYLLQGSFK